MALFPRSPLLPFTSLNWLLLVLCVVIVILVSFLLFYFNRLVAWTFSAIIRVFFWKSHNVWVECEGLQVSLLAGRLFIKDFQYHSRNESIRILKCHITWRYWLWRVQDVLEPTDDSAEGETLLKSDNVSHLPCRLHAGFEGLEIFFYNRTPAYDEIINHLQKANAESDGTSATQEGDGGRGFSLDDPQVRKNTRATVITHTTPRTRTTTRGGFWSLSLEPFSRAIKASTDWLQSLVPSFDITDILPISFSGTTCALVAGNDSTPSVLIAEVRRVTGTYGITAARSKFDLYKNVYALKLDSVKIITRTNPDHQVSVVDHGKAIFEEFIAMRPPDIGYTWDFLSFEPFHRLVRAYGDLLRKPTPKPAPKWKGLARYMTDAQRRDAGELAHEVEYAKVTTLVDTPALEVTYFVDVPGAVPENPRSLDGISGEFLDIGNGDLSPEWGVELILRGGSITYGPWADRQRHALQTAFFPSTYTNRPPTSRLEAGSSRVHTALKISLELTDSATLRLPTREASKDWRYDGLAPAADSKRKKDKRPFGWLDIGIAADSFLHYTMAMAADDNGYRNTLDVRLKNPTLSSSVNGTSFWTNDSCRILCDMPAPLQWDAARRWSFDISFASPVIHLLRDHTTLITDLIRDWSSGPPHDYDTFVPTVYNFKFGARDYNVKLYVNDHNVIDYPLADEKNSLLILHGQSLNTDIRIPVDKFRAHCRTTSFSFELPDVQVDMSLPDWNTHHTFANERPLSLGTIGSLRLDASYTAYAEVHPDHVEKFKIDIKARSASYKAYGWSIRHFLRLRDNYFGRFTHFCTTQEYIERRRQGIVGDPVLAKYRKNKSDVFEVTIFVHLLDNLVVLPVDVYGCHSALVLSFPEAQLFMRLQDYFLELTFNVNPATFFSTDDYRKSLAYRPHRPKGGRLMISSIDILAHRLLGPQPLTATYLCLWEISFGDIQGVVHPALADTLATATRALKINYSDVINAPDAKFELPLDPDLTFLKFGLGSANVVLRTPNSALQISLPDGLTLDYNDLAGKEYRKVVSIRLPSCDVKALLQSQFKKDNWLEVASIRFDVFMDMYTSPPGWRQDAARQLRFILQQDMHHKRLGFLYDSTNESTSDAGDVYLPSFAPAGSRTNRRRTFVRRLPPHLAIPEDSESDSEALTEVERRARVVASRILSSDHISKLATNQSDDSLSSGDESDDGQDTSSPSTDSELSEAPSVSSDSPRWPKVEHYHYILNRYRVARPASLADATPFVLVRDPIDVLLWHPDAQAHLPAEGGDKTVLPAESPVSTTDEDGLSVIRSRCRQPVELILTPLVMTTLRSFYMAFEHLEPTPDAYLDGLLSEFISRAAKETVTSTLRQVQDICVPDLRLSLLQRVDALRDLGPNLAGGPRQLLTAANLSIKNLQIHNAKTTVPPSPDDTETVEGSVVTTRLAAGFQRLSLNVHTTTSHPRSRNFIPKSLLHADARYFSLTFTSGDSTTLSAELGELDGTMGGKAPKHIAATFESAIRFASKISTTVSETSNKAATQRQHIVYLLMQHATSQSMSMWADPLSRTETSYLIKSGLPARLRLDLSWKVLGHIRYRLREMAAEDLHELERQMSAVRTIPDAYPKESLSRTLAEQKWLDWTNDPTEDPAQPILLEILYPESAVQRTLRFVRQSSDFALRISKSTVTITGDDSTDNTLSIGRLRTRLTLQEGRIVSQEEQENASTETEVVHALVSLSLDDIGIHIQPTLIPFVHEVIRVQRRASRTKRKQPRKEDQTESTTRRPRIMAELVLELARGRLEASALKLVLDMRTKGLRTTGSITFDPSDAAIPVPAGGLSFVVDEFRVAGKATPAGSRHAADQDTLAELTVTRCAVSLLAKDTAGERHVTFSLGQQSFIVNVPRSALKLYHFAREWRTEYTSKYDIMIRDLLAEFDRPYQSPIPPISSRTTKALIFRVNISLKLAHVLLQVMHGTWISWRIVDTLVFTEGSQSAALVFDFGVEFTSQMIDIVSQPVASNQLHPASATSVRLPLPRFSATGSHGTSGVQCNATLGRFDLKIKPQYVDDILAIQQKFGSDFADLLDLYTTKRTPKTSVAPSPKKAAFSVPVQASMKLEGFSISLEGPSSTQYLNATSIRASAANNSGLGLTWSLIFSSISLSLAHHTAPQVARSNFDRRYRSAYMEVKFRADNGVPEESAKDEKHFNLYVAYVHAVMQPAAIGELGDLIDYVQAEMVLRKEQRAAEIAEIRKKGRMVMAKLEREATTPNEASPSWLDDQIVTIGVGTVGIAFPLTAEEVVVPTPSLVPSSSPSSPPAVRAFMFSVSSITFSAQRYEKGGVDIKNVSLQFVPGFDQSNPLHFEGSNHESRNRLLLPSMTATVHSELSSQSRRALAVATVDGLELDLDTSIAAYVFSLIRVYRQGKEGIEKLAPGQARANLEAISARIATAQTAETHFTSSVSSHFSAKLGVHSGTIRLWAPNSVDQDARKHMPRRATSSAGETSGFSSTEPNGRPGVDVLTLPRLSVEGEFNGAAASAKFGSGSGEDAVSYLRLIAIVHSSNNIIRPSVLPFMVDLVHSIETNMSVIAVPAPPPVKYVAEASTNDSPSDTAASIILPAAASVMGGHLHAQFTLKIDASHLALTCQPDVNVVAALDWQSSQMIATVEPGAREVKLVGIIGGIRTSLRHEYLRESSVTAEARDLTFHIAAGKNPEYSDSIPSFSLSLKTEVLGRLRFSRLQDVLCFKAVWLDRIPVFEARPKNDLPSADLLTPVKTPGPVVPSSGPSMITIFLIVIKSMDLEVDLGSSISKLRLELQSLAVRRYQDRLLSTLSIDVGPFKLSATRALTGEVIMPHFSFKTERRRVRASHEEHMHLNQLEVQIDTGELEVALRNDQGRLLGFHADPLESRVWDDWTNVSEDDTGLRLDFSLKGGKIQALGTVSAAPYLIGVAAKVKGVLKTQREGAARESRAFRTSLHPRPTNPLSEMAAAMLVSAKTKLQEVENYDFIIVQRMLFDVASLQLGLVDSVDKDERDSDRTYHLRADSILARLERFVHTSNEAPRRDLELSLGPLLVQNFAAVRSLDVNAPQTNPTRIFTFPQLSIRMKSTLLRDPRRLAYEFDATFPSPTNAGDSQVYFILDMSEYYSLLVRAKDFQSRVKAALKDPIFKDNEEDWWDQPLRSNSLMESTPTVEPEASPPPHGSGSAAPSLRRTPSIASQAPSTADSEDTLKFESIRTDIAAPKFQQLRGASSVTHDAFKSWTGVDVKGDLPKWVHMYATVPIESIMKLLLRIYVQRLRKGDVVLGEASTSEAYADSTSQPFGSFPFPDMLDDPDSLRMLTESPAHIMDTLD